MIPAQSYTSMTLMGVDGLADIELFAVKSVGARTYLDFLTAPSIMDLRRQDTVERHRPSLIIQLFDFLRASRLACWV